MRADVGGVDLNLRVRFVRGGEADLFAQLYHHRVQAPRTDTLDCFVDVGLQAR